MRVHVKRPRVGRRLASFLILVVGTALDYRYTRVAKGDAPGQPPAESGEAAAPPRTSSVARCSPASGMAGAGARGGEKQERPEDRPDVVFVFLGFSSFFCFPA